MLQRSRNGKLSLAPAETLPGGTVVSWFALNRKARKASRTNYAIQTLENKAQPWRKFGKGEDGRTLYSTADGVVNAPQARRKPKKTQKYPGGYSPKAKVSVT